MRAQYHFRRSPDGLQAWDVRKLVSASAHLPIIDVALDDIAEIDENWWFDDKVPTPRAIAKHLVLVDAADLAYPILLCADGRLMDGMHRITKALGLGHKTIKARQLPVTPPPDFVGVAPDDLPYD